jgi:hypothetical protein
MRSFPKDFSALLTPLGLRVLDGAIPRFRSMLRTASRFAVLDRMIDRNKALACMGLLDRRLYDLLSVETSRIPADSIRSMKENHSESLQKVCRFRTAFLKRRTARAYETAEALGVLSMMRSDSFAAFAEAVAGLQLVRPPSLQIICYEHGDYVGPHNDYHPEEDPDCVGFVDFHLMLSNDAVAHQFLVYERNRQLSQVMDVNLSGGISVYRLPFWHHVTPLVGKPGREREARRWLLLATFYILGAAKPDSRGSEREKRHRQPTSG